MFLYLFLRKCKAVIHQNPYLKNCRLILFFYCLFHLWSSQEYQLQSRIWMPFVKAVDFQPLMRLWTKKDQKRSKKGQKRSKKIKKRSKEENHLTTEFDFIKTHTAITTTKPLLEKLPLIFFLVPFKYLSDKVSILCSVAVFCHCLLLGSVCADLHVKTRKEIIKHLNVSLYLKTLLFNSIWTIMFKK